MQERKIKTRNKIFASALKLFIEKGIDATSTKEITEGASVAEGTLYRHFASKDELAWALFQHHYGNIASELLKARRKSTDLRETVESTVYAFCKLVDHAPDAFRYCMLSQHDFFDRVAQNEGNPVLVIRGIIVDAIEAKQIPAGDPDVIAAMSLGVVMQPATFHLYGRLADPLINYADEFIEVIWLILNAREKKQ
ncbi:TetR family transcriptional regulator [Sneathiella chungangensis]|uniref:TetR family transcriptional regulator n=1 Tax=Sneathiella chungangensis TaxID=1418234 RepID=A0A845MFI9_9PROT|nr:TetR/AcrR family transcriptional regulator [Sneathiella chungangensis]MZR21804.1 TetR family transcriptional regulator [Sneathiella chungangensis]